jgi:hypothetical protein
VNSIAHLLVTTVTGADGQQHEQVFDRVAVIPYAYRHSYAQRHADEGVHPDVLRDLHDKIGTTLRYYRVSDKRVRAAIDRVSGHQFDSHRRRVFLDIRGLLADEHSRMRVGQVAVPFGICTEPSNVKAGGQACPYEFTCLGCGHFRSDPSYLPELKSCLHQLLADRERVQAATDLQDWAKAQLTPREEEITQLRELIRRIEAGLDDLTDRDQALIHDAVTVIRKIRQLVNLGMPAVRPPRAPDDRPVTTGDTPLARARRRDVDRRRQRVHQALADIHADGSEVTISSVADRAQVHRSFIHRHAGLHAAVLQAAAGTTTAPPPASTAISHRSVLAENANLHEQNGRLAQQVADLEDRLSEVLGQQSFDRSGLGAPAGTAAVHAELEAQRQTVLDLRRMLEERDEELAAARDTNRRLMNQLNRSSA